MEHYLDGLRPHPSCAAVTSISWKNASFDLPFDEAEAHIIVGEAQ